MLDRYHGCSMVNRKRKTLIQQEMKSTARNHKGNKHQVMCRIHVDSALLINIPPKYMNMLKMMILSYAVVVLLFHQPDDTLRQWNRFRLLPFFTLMFRTFRLWGLRAFEFAWDAHKKYVLSSNPYEYKNKSGIQVFFLIFFILPQFG